MTLRWRDWRFVRPVCVQELAWCSRSVVGGRWLELRPIAGSRTAVGSVPEAWALGGLLMLVMDQVQPYKVVLLMARTAIAVHRSLLDQHPFLS